eukprot:gene4239-4970_t
MWGHILPRQQPPTTAPANAPTKFPTTPPRQPPHQQKAPRPTRPLQPHQTANVPARALSVVAGTPTTAPAADAKVRVVVNHPGLLPVSRAQRTPPTKSPTLPPRPAGAPALRRRRCWPGIDPETNACQTSDEALGSTYRA